MKFIQYTMNVARYLKCSLEASFRIERKYWHRMGPKWTHPGANITDDKEKYLFLKKFSTAVYPNRIFLESNRCQVSCLPSALVKRRYFFCAPQPQILSLNESPYFFYIISIKWHNRLLLSEQIMLIAKFTWMCFFYLSELKKCSNC